MSKRKLGHVLRGDYSPEYVSTLEDEVAHLRQKVADQDADILAWRAALAVWHAEAANASTPALAMEATKPFAEHVQASLIASSEAILASDYQMRPDIYGKPRLWCTFCGRSFGFHWNDCRKAK